MNAEVGVSERDGRKEGVVILRDVESEEDLSPENVNPLVEEALKKAHSRLSIFVVTRFMSPGQVLGALRQIIKGHVYPSMAVWVLSEEEFEKVRSEEVRLYE